MVKALILDCFGVFYTDPVFAYMQLATTPKDVAEALYKLDEQAARGTLSKVDFISQVSVLLNSSKQDIDEQFFRGFDLNERLVEYVRKARKHLKTALLTNIGADMMDGFFPGTLKDELFDVVVFSGAVRMAKPDPEIYKLVCGQLGVPLHDAVMIDDSKNSIEGAKRLGMKTIRYKDYGQFSVDIKKVF